MDDGAKPIGRRRLLRQSAAAMALGAAALLRPAVHATEPSSSRDPMRIPGSAARPYGARSPHETLLRVNTDGISLTPLQDLHGVITPSSLHFERHHNGVPDIDPAGHRLLIHGLVERARVFTVEELKRLPSVSRLAFIECAGNTREAWGEAADTTVQQTHGLTSTSEWTGVKLATLLEAAGIRRDATWMLAEGRDAAGLDRSVPLTDHLLNEALICYGQNGEALRPEQGYPLRLLIPGYEGNINIKWLRRLKVGSAPFMTRWETSKYTDLMPDGTAYQFTLVMEAKSVITHPSGQQQIQKGFNEIRGLAWSGLGRITQVEISVDGGRRWQRAQLQEPALPQCHTRFRFPWRWNGEDAIVQSRCTDESGFVQPTRGALIAARGVHSSYHFNGIQSWHIDRDGRVRNIYV